MTTREGIFSLIQILENSLKFLIRESQEFSRNRIPGNMLRQLDQWVGKKISASAKLCW